MAPNARSYRLSIAARKDVENIWLFTLEKWSRTQADSYYDELIECFESLSNGHRRGKSIDHIKRGYLSIACGSHFVIHKQSGSTVEIIRVLHQQMNIGRHL